jgi:hypothetical protein
MRSRKSSRRRRAAGPGGAGGPAGQAGPVRPPCRGARQLDPEPLDANVRGLVDALNDFRGIRTIGSCGGHEKPGPAQWPTGSWYVKFDVARTDDGWFALEFLAWLVNNDYRRAGHNVILYPTAAPPYLNTPGQCLHWALEGHEGEDAQRLADWISRLRQESFVPPGPPRPPRPPRRPAPASAPP